MIGNPTTSHKSLITVPVAYVLHSRKYSESSIIADIFSSELGVFSVLAKGVRKPKSRLSAVLRAFTPLQLVFTGKSDLKTLTAAEAIPPVCELQGRSLYCGFYVNELIKYFIHKDDAEPGVFHHYQQCLQSLAKAEQIETALRIFEIELLENVGYGLQLEHDGISGQAIAPEKHYHYQPDLGPIEDVNGFIEGATLLALSLRQLNNRDMQRQAKQLMRQQIDFHLHGRELKSRSLYNSHSTNTNTGK